MFVNKHFANFSSGTPKIKNAKFLGEYFYMNTNIQKDFHICISVPLNPGYAPDHSVHGHQTWQGGDLQWGAPALKIVWLFDHVVLWDYVTN